MRKKPTHPLSTAKLTFVLFLLSCGTDPKNHREEAPVVGKERVRGVCLRLNMEAEHRAVIECIHAGAPKSEEVGAVVHECVMANRGRWCVGEEKWFYERYASAWQSEPEYAIACERAAVNTRAWRVCVERGWKGP